MLGEPRYLRPGKQVLAAARASTKPDKIHKLVKTTLQLDSLLPGGAQVDSAGGVAGVLLDELDGPVLQTDEAVIHVADQAAGGEHLCSALAENVPKKSVSIVSDQNHHLTSCILHRGWCPSACPREAESRRLPEQQRLFL